MEKTYELKAIKELSLKQRIVVRGKRIALLVSKLKNSLKNGYKKFMKNLVEKAGAFAETVDNKVSPVVENVVNFGQQAYSEAKEEVQEMPNNGIANIDAKIAAKSETMGALQQLDDYRIGEKSYILDAFRNDLTALRMKKIKKMKEPRRILIAAVFVKKLTTNTIGVVKNKIAEMQANRMAANPIFENNLVSSDVIALPAAMPVIDPTAVSAYEALAAKRAEIDAQMQEIATNYGISPELQASILESVTDEKKNNPVEATKVM